MKHLMPMLIMVALTSCDQTFDVGQQPVNQESDLKKHVTHGIPRGRATRYGLFRERGKGWVQQDESTSTGKLIRKAKLEFVEQTGRIPLHKGVYFGYKYWLKIEPDKPRADLKRVLIHPEMTLPDGSKVSRSERTIRKRTTHGIVTALDGYALSEDYELVEGNWTFQLWYQDDLLVEQSFTTYWPEESADSVKEPAVHDTGNNL